MPDGERSMRSISITRFAAALALWTLPAVAAAQGSSTGSISGVAKDTSGGVLPGVTVEASSSALIEGSRTAVTDERGEYKIIELRPGTYEVTFTLEGFKPVKRAGIELPANFTATVNGDLQLGNVQETITVTSAAPLVDVQNVTQQSVISKDMLSALPSGKSMLAFMAMMPSVVAPAGSQDVGGSKGEVSVRMSIHGAKQSDQRALQ